MPLQSTGCTVASLAALVCCRGSLEEEAHLRMHEVEQAVHDAEAEEAASGRDDSTGGQEGCLRCRHRSPLGALPCRGRPPISGHRHGAAGWRQAAGLMLARCHPAALLQCPLSSGLAATAPLARPAALPGLHTQGSLLR